MGNLIALFWPANVVYGGIGHATRWSRPVDKPVDPHESPNHGGYPEKRSFRTAFVPSFLYCSIWVTFIGVPCGYLVNPNAGLREVGFALIVGMVWVGVGVAVGTAVFKVHVHAQGIRSYNFWGRYRDVAWSEIEAARSINLLGIRYIRVYGKDGLTPLWIPLFLANMRHFVAMVRQSGGVTNPLVEFFAGKSPRK